MKSKSATLFAPSDEAFDDIPETEMEEILADPELAKKILGMHFLDQRIGGSDVRILQPQNEQHVCVSCFVIF